MSELTDRVEAIKGTLLFATPGEKSAMVIIAAAIVASTEKLIPLLTRATEALEAIAQKDVT